ncbi:hypothetical protein RJJ65_38440, partial [Rhizobium hidalgonense]
MNDQQTQYLPTEPDEQRRLAQSLNFNNWADFIHALDAVRAVVSSQFCNLINERNEVVEAGDTKQLLIDFEKKEYAPTWQVIEAFWKSSHVQKLPKSARARLDTFWPALIKILLTKKNPQVAIVRLIPLIESILRRSVY